LPLPCRFGSEARDATVGGGRFGACAHCYYRSAPPLLHWREIAHCEPDASLTFSHTMHPNLATHSKAVAMLKHTLEWRKETDIGEQQRQRH